MTRIHQIKGPSPGSWYDVEPEDVSEKGRERRTVVPAEDYDKLRRAAEHLLCEFDANGKDYIEHAVGILRRALGEG